MRVTFLGTGTSGGVPTINCDCDVCTSENPKNKRLRCSIMIETGGLHILVDTTPDLRQQMLTWPFPKIDAVLLTHSHADHIFGMDELRRFNYSQKGPIPVYSNLETIERVKLIYDYAFVENIWRKGVPSLTANEIKGPFKIGKTEIVPIELDHGCHKILGYRIGDFAYCTDVNHIPEESYDLLNEVKILVLDSLREKPHATHFSLQEAIAEAGKIGAAQTYFTHLSHILDHEMHGKLLPDNSGFAFDGMVLDL